MMSTEEESSQRVCSPCEMNEFRSGENESESSSDEDRFQSPARKAGPLSAFARAAAASISSKSSFSVPILPGRGERVNQVAGLNKIHVNVTEGVGAFSSKSVSVVQHVYAIPYTHTHTHCTHHITQRVHIT